MPNSICVVLDTSVLYCDYKLSSASLQGILEVATSGGAKVFLPRVAFDELIHQYTEAYDKTKQQLEEILEKFRRMSTINVSISLRTPKRPYSDFLKKLLKEKGIGLLNYPTVTHGEMIQRYFEYHKPLGKHSDKKEKDDAGYKDALIWESTLDLLREGFSKVLFVSGNTTDFGDAETGELHKELVDDLARHEYSEESVDYARSLKEGTKLLRSICSLTTPELIEAVAAQIREQVDFDVLLTTHQREIEDAIGDEIMIGDGADQPSLLWNVERSEVEIETTEVLEESGEVVVYANARFDNEIEYYIFLDDYYNIEESLNILGMSLYKQYEDINRALIGGNVPLSVQFNFIYNPTTREVSDFEVVDVQRTDVGL